jgi:hypothetical protein
MAPEQSEFSAAKKIVEDTFQNWVVNSIRATFKATSQGGEKGTPLAAYILLACAIDAIAGFYAGKVEESGTGARYRNFVAAYMPTYKDDMLYERMRCELAHNYSLGPGVILTHENPNLHRLIVGDGARIQNFEGLLEDFEAALKHYFSDLVSDSDRQKKFMDRLNAFGIVAPG